MTRVWIDDLPVDVADESSVLDAARQVGLDLPALCALAEHKANNSCMCCLVRIDSPPGIVPACSTRVRHGMRIQSETKELHQLRKTGLELLLADHAGDCHAPCENTCPAKMDIPDMLRFVARGDYRAAIATVKRQIALPAILGRVCPEVCEHACRRGQHDSPAAICKIKQFVADEDLRSAEPYSPPLEPPSGKRVAIVGAGPTGLTASYHLAQLGHQCTLFDREAQPGGRLSSEFDAEQLPRETLAAEAERVLDIGVQPSFSHAVGRDSSLEALVRDFDAVLLATGRGDNNWLEQSSVELTQSGIRVEPEFRMTTRDGVFAAGNAVRPYKLVVQSVAEGKLAADCIDRWLRGAPAPDRRRTYETRLARLNAQHVCDLCHDASPAPRVDANEMLRDMNQQAAEKEAARCLECDCRALASCLLHHYAAMYECDASHYRGEGRPYEGKLVGEKVTLELGKCILCGICLQLASEAADAAGLTFVGRSMATRISAPPGKSIDEALGSSATRCAEACPTGAIVLNDTSAPL